MSINRKAQLGAAIQRFSDAEYFYRHTRPDAPYCKPEINFEKAGFYALQFELASGELVEVIRGIVRDELRAETDREFLEPFIKHSKEISQ